jgi:hypothetical protein
LFSISGPSAVALQTTGYTSENNDRFSSGYPNNPVESASPNFVGAGLDWSGVGWAAADATKSFGFLSPQHYLVARHYGGAAQIRIFANNTLHTFSQSKTENTGLGAVFQNQTLGDLSLGTLTSAIPAAAGMARYAVLDLNTTSTANSTSAYINLPLFLYGRGPNGSSSTRIGQATINGVVVSGNNHYFTTSRTITQLEGGDSGSPALHRWSNPAGVEEITVIGNHVGINETTNFINFTGTLQVMNSLNSLMNDDGFALRVVGNPTNTWVGSSSTAINNEGAWGLSPPDSAPSDRFVNFNGLTAGNNRVVTVDTGHNLRGLYFLPTASQNLGFSIQGGSTLTVGRGGITNYDASRQTFTASLVLGAPQMWNGGTGGITATNIANNGNLLEISTGGVTRIVGALSGTGGLALSGGTLELNGNNTHTGTTWAHNGTLIVNGGTAAASTVRISNPATLGGSGTVGGPALISGTLAPGNSLGTLAFGNNLTFNTGSIFSWELTASQTGRGTNYDAVNVAGTLDGSGGIFRAILTTGTFGDTFWNTTNTWTDIFANASGNTPVSYASIFSSIEYWQNGTNITAGISQYGGFSINGSTLTWTAIPEPATTLAGLLLAAGLVRRHRKI